MDNGINWAQFDAGLHEPSPVPPGSRLKLVSMPEDPYPIPEGTVGTVQRFSNGSQVFMIWDNGMTTALLPGIDEWAVVSMPDQQE